MFLKMSATLRYRGDKNNLIEFAKNLDAFKKVPEKYTETTEIGGTCKFVVVIFYQFISHYKRQVSAKSPWKRLALLIISHFSCN